MSSRVTSKASPGVKRASGRIGDEFVLAVAGELFDELYDGGVGVGVTTPTLAFGEAMGELLVVSLLPHAIIRPAHTIIRLV